MKLFAILILAGALYAGDPFGKHDEHHGPTTPTPEPATVLAVGGGLLALACIARRKR